MNDLTTEKMMTVREVAEVLKVSGQAVRDAIKKLYPDSLINGVTTFLNEEQVTAIKLQIQSGGNRYLKDNFEVINVKTDLEKELLIFQAMQFQQEKINKLQSEVEQANNQIKMLVHDFKKLYTTTEIAKELNMKSAQDLNFRLSKMNIQYKQNGTWVLYSDYSDKGYTSIKETVLDSGKIVYDRLWTGAGRQFLINLF